MLKDLALIEAGRVVLHNAVHAVAHGRGVDFPIRNIELAVALDGVHPGNGEAQIRPRSYDMHLVGAFHAGSQRVHGAAHLVIIQRAYVEVEILKRFGTHAGLLGHGRGGIAQHHPAGLGHPNIVVHRGGI